MKSSKNAGNLATSKLFEEYEKKYNEFKSKNITLNMARGKPCTNQLDLSTPMLSCLKNSSDLISNDNIDCRNYGNMDGIPEIKELISNVTSIKKENFIVGGNSSLSMMFDTISCFMIHGVQGGTPWLKQNKIKFLCPSPGYDRHFAMCEYFGMELITIPMTKTGPDMDMVESLVLNDSTIKGMWCVPKYSNPQGITYSPETVKRIANLKPSAKDFRIFWDNAYFVHDLEEDEELLNIMDECEKAGNPELPILFFSTSKITFAGSGIAFMACANGNLKQLKKNYSFKTVGFDKINQMRHVKFLKSPENLLNHMKKQSEILKPKFKAVIDILEEEFKNHKEMLQWEKPKGGYFISVNTSTGCAKEVVSLCKEAGVILTNAGATFPYGVDPLDRNIRIAPTYPSLNELKSAMRLFCLVVKMVYIKKIM